MSGLGEHSLTTLELALEWQSPESRHLERYLARRVNLWRDVFPPGFKEALLGKSAGDTVEKAYQPGEAVPDHDPKLIHAVPRSRFQRRTVGGRIIEPARGRFYPRGMLGDMLGVYPQDSRPGRIIELDESSMVVDLNHPLAGRPLTLRATVKDTADKVTETGGRLTCWLEEIADSGPGMQCRGGGRPTSFDLQDGLHRRDETEDSRFYASPRIIGHVDAQAGEFLKETYADALSTLSAKAKVLDLMSSVQSHLPEHLDLHVTGLGLNLEEMETNPRLAERVVHDLNATPKLPFPDKSFDAVACSLSIEYLTTPQAVIAECARVLRPGGALMVGVSNRWFPTKAVRIWMDLHEFERVGLVLEYFQTVPTLTDLRTVSIRNWWRPEDDPHIDQTLTSDPVYVVMGTVQG
ncbi:methyltransferase domain-containing protein [Desulfonatronum thiodismutans]|uniref:methyltransferase domain-containing protein n=1 Tax=Desulfonatronum thiodismutans TaxID=159290 RepID=UPI0004ABE64D|nr:methyltransferase domain-containing protein [Desulfonatronum thiodismutans]